MRCCSDHRTRLYSIYFCSWKSVFFSNKCKLTFFLLRLEEENDEYEIDEYIKNYYLLNPPPPGVSLDIIKEAKLKWNKI